VVPVATSALIVGAAVGPGCERVASGGLDEPVAALTSLAFVVAALVVLAGRPEAAGDGRPAQGTVGARGSRPLYALLVAAVGVGSFVQHGPDPAWSDVAHDVPLLAVLAFLGADAAADLRARERRWWWWLVPVVLLVPVVVVTPRAGDLAGAGLAAAAVALTVVRAAVRPALRRRVGTAVALLVAGAAVGTLSRAGWPLCDPTSLWQGHGAWHVVAAVALALLAPAVGHRGGPADRSVGGRTANRR
jgi:hypothetical protein